MKVIADATKFLLTSFKDKKGSTRAATTSASVLLIVFTTCITRGEFSSLKTTVQTQADEIALLHNTLAKHGIYVPELVTRPVAETPASVPSPRAKDNEQ